MGQWSGANSTTLKLALIGLMSLGMLVPLGMVDGLVRDRQRLQHYAETQISEKWGNPQAVGGPLAAVTTATDEGDLTHRFQLPASLSYTSDLTVETRYLGIFEMQVYVAIINIKGHFKNKELAVLSQTGTVNSHRYWLLPLSHVRGIRKVSAFTIGGQSVDWQPTPYEIRGLSGITAPLAADLFAAESDGSGTTDFELTIEIAGTQQLEFLPLGQRTTARLSAPWASPGFTGAYLPHEHDISSNGFTAHWQVLELNRQFGQSWLEPPDPATIGASAFGANLYFPASAYQRVERSVKYGVLFIALTFMGFFVCERLLSLRLHPVQYVFIGLCLAVFYLVLLALSEHLVFWIAYWLAAAALVAMMGGYCAVILHKARRGAGVAGSLTTIYALLYWLVIDEQYSLLVGAVAVTALLAITLYVTRHVDWYSLGEPTDLPRDRANFKPGSTPGQPD